MLESRKKLREEEPFSSGSTIDENNVDRERTVSSHRSEIEKRKVA